jgi:hypothetical protein
MASDMAMGCTTRVLVWPDGAWMYADEHDSVLDAWRGDEYGVTDCPFAAAPAAVSTLLELELSIPVRWVGRTDRRCAPVAKQPPLIQLCEGELPW